MLNEYIAGGIACFNLPEFYLFYYLFLVAEKSVRIIFPLITCCLNWECVIVCT